MTQISVRNPHSGEIDYHFEQSTAQEIKDTCTRLRAAQPEWEALGLEGRISVLEDFAKAMEANYEKVFNALKIDTGRAMIAQHEAMSVGNKVKQLSADARKMLQEKPDREAALPGIIASGQWVPYGLVGNISPWNFPLILSFVDTLPALITGNAVIIKPSEVNPRWVDPVEDIVSQIPALAKVLAFVRGPGETGAELINHVDLIAFTGSVRTGRLVGEAAARNFIPAFLELGGKDPAIVLESANLEATTSGILRASVAATGQACQSLERVYVAAPLYDAFVEKIAEKAANVTLNRETLEEGYVGPLIFEKQAATIKDHIEDAKAKGARVLNGGEIINQGGIWVEPTILVDVNHTMKVMTEETFGPVIPIQKVESTEEAIALANDTVYGLSASVYGDAEEALPVAKRLNAGTISINDGSLTAFVSDVECESFGLSGLGGTRFGSEGVLRFVRRKAILNNTVGPSDVTGQRVSLA